MQFFFYAAEEPRAHVHMRTASGSAKIWLEPVIELAHYRGLSRRGVGRAITTVHEHAEMLRAAWRRFHEND